MLFRSKLSPEDFVHYKSEQTQKLRKELGDFEQRYKAWIVWTIVTPEDPVERAQVIRFWFEVAKVREICFIVWRREAYIWNLVISLVFSTGISTQRTR